MLDTLRKIKSLHILIGICILLVATVIKFSPWQNAGKPGKLIAWDVTSYYGYLPATFIEDDLTLNFVSKDSAYYHDQQMYWPETAPNGGKVIKTTMGLSILYSPFFFIANSLDQDESKTQGFSKTYEFWLTISSIFFTILGAVFLRLFLLKHFPDWIVSTTLIIIYFGTNLFYYITVEPLMPHSYNFFLISLFLLLTANWYSRPTLTSSILIGFVFGLITLIRPINGILALFFITYNLQSIGELRSRFQMLLQQYGKIIIVAICAFLVILPQLLYWHKITGSFIFNSYPGEHFFWSNPHIIDGLFSYRKGWLLYTPIMLFAIVGLWFDKKNKISSLTVLFPAIYIMFSWWNWWYGGGFGCRPIIDLYPILSIGFAALLFRLSDVQWAKGATLLIFLMLIMFNLFQTLQRKSEAIHWESMTKEAYWYNFLHRNPRPGFKELLKAPNIEKAKAGEEEY